jgi:hypothetical protein
MAIPIKLSCVPEYIRSGSLFRFLTRYEEEISNTSSLKEILSLVQSPAEGSADEELMLPAQYCKFEDIFPKSFIEAENLLATLRYWGVEDVPSELLNFLLESDISDECIEQLREEFGTNSFNFISDLKYLRAATAGDRLAYAAKKGNLHLLKSIYEGGMGQWPNETVVGLYKTCAEVGHLNCLRYLHDQGCPWSSSACSAAAQGGHLECLQYLHEQGCPCTVWVCSSAAEGGHLACLMYAHEHGIPWHALTCSKAAAGGHLPCLQYAHERGCPLNDYTCRLAAQFGQLACLKYLTERKCPWTAYATYVAVRNGHLGCLQYLRENGCPLDSHLCECAIEHGRIDCLRYVHWCGCLMPAQACEYAAKGGHLECLRYARETASCRWFDARWVAERNHHTECIEYLDANGCP